MKRLLFFLMLIGLSACEFYYLEPRYDACNQIQGWHDVEEYSETYNDYTNYSIYIGYSDSYSNDIYIDNFYGADIRVCAYLSNGKIDIHRQVVDGYEIEGIGTVYGNEIQFIYSVKDVYLGTRRDYCESTAWRE